MKCHEARAWLAARRDLSWAQEREVQAHLARCPACTEVWQREERIMRRLRAVPVPHKELPKAAEIAIRQAIAGKSERHQWWSSRIALLGAVLGVVLSMVFIGHGRLTTLGERARSAVAPSGSPVIRTDAGSQQRQKTFYVGSLVLGAHVGDIRGARVTALEAGTQREKFTIAGGFDAILSPDQTQLYIVGIDADEVAAFDTQAGSEQWRVSVEHSQGYPHGGSILATSPDGRWLYVSSYVAGDSAAPPWLQIVDTTTGQRLPHTVPLPDCRSPKLTTPPTGEMVYILCPGEIRMLNTKTQQIEGRQQVVLAGWTQSVVSPDGHRLYMVDQTGRLEILDIQQQTIHRESLPRAKDPLSSGLAVALSGDGMTLVVAQTLQAQFGTDNASLLRVFDTRTWDEASQFRFEQPMAALATNHDASVIYAAFPMDTPATQTMLPADTIVEFSAADGQVRTQYVRPDENIQRLFFGP